MVARLFKDAMESENPIVTHFVWERDDGQSLNMGMPKPHPSFPSASIACQRLDQRIGQWVSGEKPTVDKNALVRLEVPGLAQFDFSLESFEKSALSDDGSLVVGIGVSKGVGREPMAIAKVARLKLFGADGKAVGRRQALLPIKDIIHIQKREREAQAKKLASQEQQIDEGMDIGRVLAQEEDRQWAEDSRETAPAAPAVAPRDRGQASDGVDRAKMMMDMALTAVGKNMASTLKSNPLPVAQAKQPSAPKAMTTGQSLANDFAAAIGETPEALDQSPKGDGSDAPSQEELAAHEALAKLRSDRELAAKEQEAAEKAAQEALAKAKAEREQSSAKHQATAEKAAQEALAKAKAERELADKENKEALAAAKAELDQAEREKEQALASSKAELERSAKIHEEDLARAQSKSDEKVAELMAALELARGQLETDALARSEEQRELKARLDQEREELEKVKKALEIATREKTPSQVKASTPSPALDIDFVKAVFPGLPDGVDEIFISLSKADLFAAFERLEGMGELEMRLASKNETHVNVGICVPAGKVAMLADFISEFSKGGVMVKRSHSKADE